MCLYSTWDTVLEVFGEVKDFDFDAYIEVDDLCRKTLAAKRRKQAYFSQPDFDKLFSLFDARCQTGVHEISKGDWVWLLVDVGVPVDTKEARERIFGLVAQAHEVALDAGVAPDELGNNKDDSNVNEIRGKVVQ